MVSIRFIVILALLASQASFASAAISRDTEFTVSGTITGEEESVVTEEGGSAGSSNSFQTIQNVRELEANFNTSERANVLTWRNPLQDIFDSVRVVRSTRSFPADPYDGEIVFEGNAERFVDRNVSLNTVYYYTVFSKSTFDTFSSGAIVWVRAGTGVTPSLPDLIPDAPAEEVPQVIKDLTIRDFVFIQHGKILTAADGSVALDGDAPFEVLLPYSRVPEVLKTIAVTLFHPSDAEKRFSFLLRANADKTAYIASVGALEEGGDYNATIMMLNYGNQALTRINAVLEVSASQKPVIENAPDILPIQISLVWLLLIALAYGVHKTGVLGRNGITRPVW